MNLHPHAATQSHPGTEITPLHLNARLAHVIQTAWLLYMAIACSLLVVGTPLTLAWLKQPCGGIDCAGQLSFQQIQALQNSGFSVSAYAAFLLTLALLLAGLGLTLATLLIWRKPTDLLALSVAVFFGVCTVNVTAIPEIISRQFPALAFPLRFFYISTYAFLPLFTIFPNGRFVPRWAKWLALLQLLLALSDWFFPALHELGGPLEAIDGMWVTAYTLLVLGFLFYRYRRTADTIQRQQMKWVVYGVGLVLLFGILSRVIASPIRTTWAGSLIQSTTGILLVAFLILTFWFAIWHYRLFDVDLLINRTLVYGILTAAIILLYSVLVSGLNALLRSNSNVWISLLVTGLITALFQPVRDRLQRAVNRLMYGMREEPYQVVMQLGQRLETAIDPAMALTLTVETVAIALKLPYVAIALAQDGIYQTVAAFGTAQDRLTRFPLTYAGKSIGELSAAVRKGEAAFTPVDQRLLTDLARHIGSSAQAALIAIDLERARIRNVETSEETRRQLGSDLHDGVGHQLAGLTRQAERASNLLGQNPDAVRDILEDIKTQLNHTSVAVRQLAHQLYPPELELLGLVGAIQERVAALSSPNMITRMELPQPLPHLPTALESTVYFIALEALTNVSKHAEANSCILCLEIKEEFGNYQSPVLVMEICDDGRGLMPGVSTGLGRLSMQARAAEVGGVCNIEPNPGGGTRVSVRLPCHC